MKTKIFLLTLLLPISASANSYFTDISHSPFKNYINKSAELGIISGYGNGSFKPNHTVSFIESLKIIINAGPKKSQIIPQKHKHWSAPFKKFYQEKYFTNLVNFSDNEAISRDFAIYLLLRQLDIFFTQEDYRHIAAKFPDIHAKTPFAPYIIFSKEMGITNGFSDGLFRPKNSITRGELTKMAYNTLIEKREEILKKYQKFRAAHPLDSSAQLSETPLNIDSGKSTITVREDQVLPLSKVKTLVKNQVRMQENVVYFASIDPERIDVLINTKTNEKFFPRVNFSEYTLFYTHNGGEILSKNLQFSDLPAISNEMVILINNFRKNHRLPPVKIHSTLQKVAQNYAQEMHKTGHFDHVSLSGEDASTRVEKANYHALGVAENISKGQLSVQEAMQSFIDSPSHRANMLHAETLEVGIGFYGNYWVQVFAAAEK